MKPTTLRNAICLAVPLMASAAVPSSAQVTAELDAYWEQVVKSVRTGDADLYASTFHPDGIFVSARRGISRTVMGDIEANRDAWRATAEGRAERDLAFRFTRRINDHESAHERGIFRYSSIENGETRVVYIWFDAMLVKKDGVWLNMVEYQDRDATLEEWEAAGR